MAANEHYLDYTGSSVYCQSQLDAVFKELRTCMFGNPHSANPSSAFTSSGIDEVGGPPGRRRLAYAGLHAHLGQLAMPLRNLWK